MLVFKTELLNRCMRKEVSHGEMADANRKSILTHDWVKQCEGKPVTPESTITGDCEGYLVKLEWCEDV